MMVEWRQNEWGGAESAEHDFPKKFGLFQNAGTVLGSFEPFEAKLLNVRAKSFLLKLPRWEDPCRATS